MTSKPLEELRSILKTQHKINERTKFSLDDITNFHHALWEKLENFEEVLDKSMKIHIVEKRNLIESFNARIKFLKEKCLFQFDVFETALVEQRTTMQKDYENLCMKLNDVESF
jgi:hypothetical protein